MLSSSRCQRSSPQPPASSMHFLDALNPEQREAVLHIARPAADPRRRRLRQDARHHQPHRLSRRRRPCRAARGPRGHVHQQGRRGDARARRGAARLRLQPACGSRRSTRSARGCCAARRRPSACRATSSSTTRPTSSRSSSRRSRSCTSTTASCSRGRRCRASATRRTGWRAPGAMAGGGRLEPPRRADRQDLRATT